MSVRKPDFARVRVAALGYYGFGNLGDEAVLAGIRVALGPTGDFLVLSNNPNQTARLHPGTRAVNRWQWREVAAALRGVDLFILGGGSLLQDATSVQSVVWYGLMALLARRRARRVLWWGQGIGPLVSPVSRRVVRLIANGADALTVRDTDSAQLLKEIGARGSIQVVADPAFALDPPQTSLPTGEPSTLLALRRWRDDRMGAVFKENAGLIQTAGGLQGLPMHLPDDADYMRGLPGGESLKMRDWQAEGLSPTGVLGEVARARLVVAMRLHALIFAARCATPFVALRYDPKVSALATAAGQADALLDIDTLRAGDLTDAIMRVEASVGGRRAHLQAWAAGERERALVPAEVAAQWF